jgi:Lon protease-like protein
MEEINQLVPATQSPAALVSILECNICLSLLCEPISLSCGHTYCRVCLVKSLRRHKKQCPGCREVCHVSAENAAENYVIKSLAMALDPNLYKQRVQEGLAEKEAWLNLYPIFFYGQKLLPFNKLNLHLFEPRYKIMMNNIVNSSRAFVYVCPTGNRLEVGELALVADVKEAEFLADGRCILEANLSKRSRIVEHYVEDGTQGLCYCRVEPVNDDPVPPELAEEASTLKARALVLVNEMLADDFTRRQVTEQYCAMPTSDLEAFSMWLCCVGPLGARDVSAALAQRNTLERLRLGIRHLERLLEQRRNPRFPFAAAVGNTLASTLSAMLGTAPPPAPAAIPSPTDNPGGGEWHGVEEGRPRASPRTATRAGAGTGTGAGAGADANAHEDSDSEGVPSLISDSDDSSDDDAPRSRRAPPASTPQPAASGGAVDLHNFLFGPNGMLPGPNISYEGEEEDEDVEDIDMGGDDEDNSDEDGDDESDSDQEWVSPSH